MKKKKIEQMNLILQERIRDLNRDVLRTGSSDVIPLFSAGSFFFLLAVGRSFHLFACPG